MGGRAFAAYATTAIFRNTRPLTTYSSRHIVGYTTTATQRYLGGPTVFSPPKARSFALLADTAMSDASEVDVALRISSVQQRIEDVISTNDRRAGSVRLVAVSKTKPLDLLQAAYQVRLPNPLLFLKNNRSPFSIVVRPGNVVLAKTMLKS